jgi:hypothetical protein
MVGDDNDEFLESPTYRHITRRGGSSAGDLEGGRDFWLVER